MSDDRRIHKVYKSVNAPMTLGGIERRLFFMSAILGGSIWLAANTLLGGLLVFVVCLGGAKQLTEKDPDMIAIMMRSAKYKVRYDGAKFKPVSVVRIDDV